MTARPSRSSNRSQRRSSGVVGQTVETATVTSGAGAGRDRSSNTMPTDLTPEQQLEELVRDHLDAVYRVAFSVVRDSALAEDVSQDAILKAWNALPTFRGESTLRSWLLRITHNTAISTLRRRREELRDPNLLPERPSSSTTESAVEGRLSVDAFEAALDQLDDLSRSIVVLREIEGFSYDEIADILEVALPTVKTRLLRARRILASALEEWRP
ncbi:MAG: RNA polymerase sigma factor [Acidimicrobiia bacterium]|nr:RNA polymerase sigma factor [Acidimicrobiia bacterium]